MEADVSSGDGDAPRSALVPQKPCDACRQRKIKCDRQAPCSHCRAAGIACRTSQRVKEERTRVTISKQYEQKIDTIDDRLARIEKLLRSANGSHTSPAASNPSLISTLEADDHDVDSPAIDDVATTGHHRDTLIAKNVFEQTISSNERLAEDPQLTATLQALKRIVGKLGSDGKGMTLSTGVPSDNSPEMPSWVEIEKLLARGKAHPPESWELYVVLVPMDEFVTMCESFHRDRNDGSIAQQTIVYAGLYCLAGEFAAEDAGDSSTYHWNIGLKFLRFAMDTISLLPILAPARRDTISALLISVSQRQPCSFVLNARAGC